MNKTKSKLILLTLNEEEHKKLIDFKKRGLIKLATLTKHLLIKHIDKELYGNGS